MFRSKPSRSILSESQLTSLYSQQCNCCVLKRSFEEDKVYTKTYMPFFRENIERIANAFTQLVHQFELSVRIDELTLNLSHLAFMLNNAYRLEQAIKLNGLQSRVSVNHADNFYDEKGIKLLQEKIPLGGKTDLAGLKELVIFSSLTFQHLTPVGPQYKTLLKQIDKRLSSGINSKVVLFPDETVVELKHYQNPICYLLACRDLLYGSIVYAEFLYIGFLHPPIQSPEVSKIWGETKHLYKKMLYLGKNVDEYKVYLRAKKNRRSCQISDGML